MTKVTGQKTIQIPSETSSLACSLFAPEKANCKNPVLFLYGGSYNRGKERFYEWQEFLSRQKVCSLSFDYSGCGESVGVFAKSSLSNRIRDAGVVIEWIVSTFRPASLSLYAGSMGAYVACSLAATYQQLVQKLLLFGPAAYSQDAHHLQLNRQFTETLRQLSSWRNSLSFSWIGAFSGKLLIVISEKDEVVPLPIATRYLQSAEQATGKHMITINDATHHLLKQSSDIDPAWRNTLYQRSLEFYFNS